MRISLHLPTLARSVFLRMVALVLALTAVVFVVSYTALLNTFRVDDFVQSLTRYLSDQSHVKKFCPVVKVITADETGNGQLGSPGVDWREHHAALIGALSEAGARAIVIDLTFENPDGRGGTLDDKLGGAIVLAEQRNCRVIGAKAFTDDAPMGQNGEPKPRLDINDRLKPAFRSWGNVNVGSSLNLPFLGAFVSDYKVATILPGATALAPDGELAVLPSLALKTVMQTGIVEKQEDASANQLEAFYNEIYSEVRLREGGSGGPVRAKIPVVNVRRNLYLTLDIATRNTTDLASKHYEDLYKWSTSGQDKAFLKTEFGGSIILLGYNTAKDRRNVIGDGQRSGTEIHANVVSNILTQTYIWQLSAMPNFIVIALMVTMGILLRTKLKGWSNKIIPFKLLPKSDKEVEVPVLFLVIAGVYLVIAYEVFLHMRVSFDIVAHLLAFPLGYLAIGFLRKRQAI